MHQWQEIRNIANKVCVNTPQFRKNNFLSLICVTYLMALVLQFIQCTQIANK